MLPDLPKILMWWGILSVPAALFTGAFIRFGMGSEETPAETACRAFDEAQSAYKLACKRHHGQSDAWRAMHAAMNARLRREVAR